MYNDPMMAVQLYRIEVKQAEEDIDRRRAALEHPGLIRRVPLRTRARRLWSPGGIALRESVEPG